MVAANGWNPSQGQIALPDTPMTTAPFNALPTPQELAAQIAAQRVTSVADYMGAMNAHYYATRDPLGAAGDFTTAPEISQLFGEMIGIWIADIWTRAGRPPFRYAELGPGRGTLAVDALRVMARFQAVPQSVHLVETSPILAAAQLARIPHAQHHDDVDALPDDLPLVIIANEFFDALPIHQYIRTIDGWRERVVVRKEESLIAVAGDTPADDLIPPALRQHGIGTIVETTPLSAMIMRKCAARITRQGGAMLAIDYGYSGPAAGDTLQALKAHEYVDVFANPGEVDITAHVDFTSLSDAATAAGARCFGPAQQGHWLQHMGVDARTQSLGRAAPDRQADLLGQRNRLVEADQMGQLFKALAITAPHWPTPEGFGPAA
jgi:NADH dehydrogenase [ubiquinone] 1 alpha subcomplex assembly factor 7